MKIFKPLRKHTVRIVSCMIAIVLLTAGADSYAIPTLLRHRPLPASYNDSVVVKKQITSKKYKIRLYPNAGQQVLFFSARGDEGKIYQLFLFDMDGQLVKQANIRNKQTTVINIIDKGIYLFEVFIEDKRIEKGRVTVL